MKGKYKNYEERYLNYRGMIYEILANGSWLGTNMFLGIPLIFSMMRDNGRNLSFIIGGLGGLIFMVLGLAMTMSKKPKQVNPFFK